MVTVAVLSAILMIVAALLVAALVVTVLGAAVRRRGPFEPVPAAAPAELLPGDRTRDLLSQFAAGVRGSRAPPAASA
ncbi:hypothetical protein [Actinoplanes sp. M2I2]|uniref:hypothetical protein n=1 Tax=Actinoplanes sp. M2I2 TaxID=1734444 RepID=UPI00202156BD|nr:hypothetical protein [Actinoplanes sp. M2I2]